MAIDSVFNDCYLYLGSIQAERMLKELNEDVMFIVKLKTPRRNHLQVL